MSDEPYFKDIPQIGNLYFYLALNEFEDENILFVCKDNVNQLYLCCCYEIRRALKYIINKIDKETLIKLISEEIPIRDALILGTEKKIRIIFTENDLKIDFPKIKDLNSVLPTKNIYLRLDL